MLVDAKSSQKNADDLIDRHIGNSLCLTVDFLTERVKKACEAFVAFPNPNLIKSNARLLILTSYRNIYKLVLLSPLPVHKKM